MRYIISLFAAVMLIAACGGRNTKSGHTESDKVINTTESSKEGDEILADGEPYFTLSCEPVHDADWSEVDALPLPQINTDVIEGEYAKQCNREIRDLYEKLKKDHDAFYIGYDGSGHGPESSYEWTLTGDILSLIITYDYSGWAVTAEKYMLYNLNIKTGQPVGADEMIALNSLTPGDIKKAIDRANKDDGDGVLEYPDTYHYRNLGMYLGEEGLVIYVFRVLNRPTEIDRYLIPFRPAEWLQEGAGGISMDEALDLLAKQLNDTKLKYMLGEDSESRLVNGENTYYIRAYHDMETHIVTLGHFYIGRLSGKIYIDDLVKGEIVPY